MSYLGEVYTISKEQLGRSEVRVFNKNLQKELDDIERRLDKLGLTPSVGLEVRFSVFDYEIMITLSTQDLDKELTSTQLISLMSLLDSKKGTMWDYVLYIKEGDYTIYNKEVRGYGTRMDKTILEESLECIEDILVLNTEKGATLIRLDLGFKINPTNGNKEYTSTLGDTRVRTKDLQIVEYFLRDIKGLGKELTSNEIGKLVTEDDKVIAKKEEELYKEFITNYINEKDYVGIQVSYELITKGGRDTIKTNLMSTSMLDLSNLIGSEYEHDMYGGNSIEIGIEELGIKHFDILLSEYHIEPNGGLRLLRNIRVSERKA